MTLVSNSWLDEVNWDANGLVPVIAQEYDTGHILMFAWMNREALLLTYETKRQYIGHGHVLNCGAKVKNQDTSSLCMKYV